MNKSHKYCQLQARLKGIYIVWFYSIEKDNIYLQVESGEEKEVESGKV